jgi:hypothetical protein
MGLCFARVAAEGIEGEGYGAVNVRVRFDFLCAVDDRPAQDFWQRHGPLSYGHLRLSLRWDGSASLLRPACVRRRVTRTQSWSPPVTAPQWVDLPGFNGETLTLSLLFQLQRQLAIGIQALNDAGRDCRSR